MKAPTNRRPSAGQSPTRHALTAIAAVLTLTGAVILAPVVSPTNTGLPPATATTATYQVTWAPNSVVRAIADDGADGQYFGGDFNGVDLKARGFAVMNPATGNDGLAVDRRFPAVDGNVNAVVSDGNGGWFVGGEFNTIGSPITYRTNLAHVNADGSVDENWNLLSASSPSEIDNGPVNALALADGVLYVGGAFTGPEAALLAVDAASGEVMVGAFDSGGAVNTIAVEPSGSGFDGARVYVGGTFSDGTATRRLAAFVCDGTTGECGVDPSWSGSDEPDDGVSTLAFDSTNQLLYLGGAFEAVGSNSNIPYLARVDATTGMLDSTWVPEPDNRVNAIDLDNGLLYAGGLFEGVNGLSATREYLAAFDLATGVADAWDPAADDVVLSLDASNSNVYVGGDFTSVGGEYRTRFAELDATTGLATGLHLDPDDTVTALAVDSAGIVAIGGMFTTIATIARNKAAQLDADGTLTDWAPNVTGGTVKAIVKTTDGVLLGGTFTGVNGGSNGYLATVDASTGSTVSGGVTANGAVNAFYATPYTQNAVYVGGDFTTLNGSIARSKLAKLTHSSGAWSVNSWTADLTGGQVYALTGELNLSGNLYVGGSFTGCSVGTCGPNAAAFAYTDATLNTTWKPNPNNTVYALAYNSLGHQIHLGGAFTSLAGNSNRQYAGAVADVSSWSATALTNLKAWNPRPDGTVYALTYPGAAGQNGTMMMGGAFTKVTSDVDYPRAGLAAVTVQGLGTARAWNPLVTSSPAVYAIAWSGGSTVAAGGNFVVANSTSANFGAITYQNTGGIFEFTPTDFGVVPSGSRQLSIMVFNRSGFTITTQRTVSLSAVATSAGVTIAGDTCSDYNTISPNSMCTIDLQWAPASAGNLAANALVQIAVYGWGAPSAAELSGTTYQPGPLTFTNAPGFGDVPVGTTATATVTVTNTGLSPATPSAITAAGSGVSVTGGTCAATRPMAVSGTCTVDLAWTPTSQGALSGGSLTIAYPDGANPSSSVALTGTGRQPGDLTFSSGAFGSKVVGASAALTVTVTNTGNATATPSAITVTGTGVSKTGGTCAVSTGITANGTCTVVLAWTPATVGALTNAALTITYPDGAVAANALTLTGTGVIPGPLTFIGGAFGTVTVASAQVETVTVTNTGTANATPSAITVAGTDVSKTGGTCAVSTTITPAGTCTVEVTWSPTAVGSLSGSLTIAYPNGANPSDVLTLTGTAATSGGGGGSGGGGSGGGGSTGGGGSPTTPKPQPAPATPSAPVATNPPADGTTTAAIAGPISRVSGPTVALTKPLLAARPPSTALGSAPTVTAAPGAVARVGLQGLRPSTRYTVTIRVNGRWHWLGWATTGARGRTTTPAFTSETAGTFPLRLTHSGDPNRYVSVRIT